MTYSTTQLCLLARQLAALRVRYPGLHIEQCRPGLSVRGKISFSMEHKTHTVEDTFDLELRIPSDYPKKPPSAYETKGRLNGYDHLFPDGRLCLGAPVDVCMRFAKQPTLLSFVEELVVPFLFAFSYKNQYGEMPFGELTHGVEGLLDYYADFFGTPKEVTVYLLMCLAGGYRQPHSLCPCGSGRKLRKCHGPRLDTLRAYLSAQAIRDELRELISANRTIRGQRRPVLPRRLRRRLARHVK